MEGGFRGVVIVFSAFMIQLLAFGNYACIGIYTVHLLVVFDNDAVGVSLISAIHYAVLLCCGPLASFLMTKISFRKLSLIGAALVSIGIFCMPLLINLPAMYVFFGVFAGLGGCLIYLPSHVLSGLYYDKYRTISTGVATAGTGMGAMVMPLIVGILIEEYTWKGSLMILAGLDLHLFIFALFMIQPSKGSKKQKACANVTENEVHYSHTNGTTDQNKQGSLGFRSLSRQSSITSQYQRMEPYLEKVSCSQSQSRHKIRRVNSKYRNNEEVNSNVRDHEDHHGEHVNSPEDVETSSLDSLPEDDISRVFIPSYLTWVPSFRSSFYLKRQSSILETAILGSEEELLSDTHEDKYNYAERVSIVSSTKGSFKHVSVKEHFKENIRVLTNFKFFIYLISTLIWSMTTTMFATFGPELIVMKGHEAVDAAFVFTFYGLGQLIGCVFISIAGNFLGRHVVLYIVANVLTGGFMSLVPLFHSFTELAIVLVVLGFVFGGILGLYMIVSTDLVGVNDMEIGLGYVLLASGVGCFAGPPLGGFMSKIYGGYNESFYMGGIVTIFGGLIMSLVYLPQCSGKNNNQKQPSIS